jgi:hypothetical protein
LALVARNIAARLHCVADLEAGDVPGGVEIRQGERSVRLRCALDRWIEGGPVLARWRGIAYPALPEDAQRGEDEFPDLFGLGYFLFHDVAEIRHERLAPGQRFQAEALPYGAAFKEPFFDLLVNEARAALGLEPAPACLVLTHDIDHLSLQRQVSRKDAFQRLLGALAGLHPRLAWKTARELMEVLLHPELERPVFEFLQWAEVERARGYRSVYFAFSDARRHGYPSDARYTLEDREREDPRRSVAGALRGLIANGHVVGPHLSLSAEYRFEAVRDEYDAFGRAVGAPVLHVRNHWTRMRYSDWFQWLRTLGVRFDFNVCALDYPKGTQFPYVSSGGPVVVPTIFMDDFALKPHRANLDEDSVLGLLARQLARLDALGGAAAWSFHPAEDAIAGTTRVADKLALYQKALDLVARSRVRVALPEQAVAAFLPLQDRP